MTNLSGSHDVDAAGLPRGRNSLSTIEAREKQRRRLVKAATSAFANKGFAATTISDIVKHARVSRQVFYEIFESKEDCFLAADELGRQSLLNNVLTDLQRIGVVGDSWIRLPLRAYLQLCIDEPEFSKAWAVEFPNAGIRSLSRRNEFFVELGQLLQQAHQVAKKQNPQDWTVVPSLFYEAAVGGAYEIIYRCISQNRFQDLLALENTLVDFIQTAVGYRPQ